ncbi:hypothetical protein [Microcystis phage Mwe-JY08]
MNYIKIPLRRRARPWTDEEVKWLTANFTNYSNAQLARKLDRSQTRVVTKLCELGLTSRDTPRPKQATKHINVIRAEVVAAYGRESSRAVAERLGITRRSVIGIWYRDRQRKLRTRTIPSVVRSVVRADSSQSSFHQLRRVSVSLPRLKFLEAAE